MYVGRSLLVVLRPTPRYEPGAHWQGELCLGVFRSWCLRGAMPKKSRASRWRELAIVAMRDCSSHSRQLSIDACHIQGQLASVRALLVGAILAYKSIAACVANRWLRTECQTDPSPGSLGRRPFRASRIRQHVREQQRYVVARNRFANHFAAPCSHLRCRILPAPPGARRSGLATSSAPSPIEDCCARLQAPFPLETNQYCRAPGEAWACTRSSRGSHKPHPAIGPIPLVAPRGCDAGVGGALGQ